jgi:hypothetical protein
MSNRKEETMATRRRMLVANQIDLLINELVRQVRQLVDETGVAASQMEKHQFSNLLGVALDTKSVELVKNFIQYQMGRDVRGTAWRAQNFGGQLVRDLDGLRKKAGDIALNLYDALELDGEPTEREIGEIWIEVARQYVGQLNRYFYYKKEAQRWGKR